MQPQRTLYALLLALSLFAPANVSASVLSYFSEKAAEWARDLLKNRGIDLTWKQFEAKDLDSGWGFEATDVCVETTQSLEKLCFKSMAGNVRYKLKIGLPEISAVGPLTATGGSLVIRPSKKKEEPDSNAPIRVIPLPPLKLPGLLKKTAFEKINLEVDNVTIRHTDGSELKGSLALMSHGKDSRLGPIHIKGEVTGLPDETSVAVTLDVTSDSHFSAADLNGTININIDSPREGALKGNSKITVDALESGNALRIKADSDFTKQRLSTVNSVTGVVSKEDIRVDINGHIESPQLTPTVVSWHPCGVHLIANRMSFTCNASATNIIHSANQADVLDLVDSVSADVKLNINHQGIIPLPTFPWRGTIELTASPLKTSWLVANAFLSGSFSGSLVDWKRMVVDAKTKVDLDLKSFHGLVQQLDGSPLSIPAPFRTLDGTLRIESNGFFKTQRNKLSLPLSVESDLESPEQAVKFTSNGNVTVSLSGLEPQSSHIDLSTRLRNIRLQAPDLNPGSLPSLSLDSRIKTARAEKTLKKQPEENTFPLTYQIEIVSESERAIEVLTEHTEQPLGIEVDLVARNDAPLSGKVTVAKTDLELFRRDAILDHFKLTLKEPIDASTLDGAVEVKYVDYTVFIKVAGTASRPRVILESEPPLPEDDVISVLLFGEPMGSLDSSDSDSVGEVSAAMADRALALTSMYLLASTPVQRVGYNPASKKITARIRLATGTSLVVGGSEDSQEAGIRRSLGSGWYLTTLVRTPDENSDTTLSAFLEWLRRF